MKALGTAVRALLETPKVFPEAGFMGTVTTRRVAASKEAEPPPPQRTGT
jgi:hypothetical protein